MKFHALVHLVQDILLFGVPSEFDTGSNESHHKPSKYAAKLTQRKESTFHFQTAVRLTEFLILDLAMQEIVHGMKLWEYFDFAEGTVDARIFDQFKEGSSKGTDEDEFGEDLDGMLSDMREMSMETEDGGLLDEEMVSEKPKPPSEDMDSVQSVLFVKTGGTRIEIWVDADNDYQPTFSLLGRSKTAKEGKSTWGEDIINFLHELQNLTEYYLPKGKLPVLTQHRRGSEIYHGHPNFRGKGFWRDWTLVDWAGGYGIRPAHIWCFVELENMPGGTVGTDLNTVVSTYRMVCMRL